jgi:prevent-host-death family protein
MVGVRRYGKRVEIETLPPELAELVRHVENGETIILTRNGVDVAMLVPIHQPPPQQGFV